MNELVITLEIPGDIADSCCKSIGIEARGKSNRSTVGLEYDNDGNFLKIIIESEDLHAIRAALNTHLRWVIMCCDLLSNDTRNGTNSQRNPR